MIIRNTVLLNNWSLDKRRGKKIFFFKGNMYQLVKFFLLLLLFFLVFCF